MSHAIDELNGAYQDDLRKITPSKIILGLEAGLILSVSSGYMNPKILMPPTTIYLWTCRGRQKKEQ